MACAIQARADEVTSNGQGGGDWSDPASWIGKKAPGPDDEVVIQRNDVIHFDRNDDGKPSCRKLIIDPKGGFTFKPRSGKLVCSIVEGIESYGAIRIDGTKAPGDDFELRLSAPTLDRRQIKLKKGAAFFVYGHADLPKGKRNVRLSSLPPNVEKDKDGGLGVLEADGFAMVDFLRADVENVKVIAKKLDNTGAKPGERIKVHESNFTGVARLYIHNCDTPEVNRNRFEYPGSAILAEPAVTFYFCPLTEFKNNTVVGKYGSGVFFYSQSDTTLANNVFEKCDKAIVGNHLIPNTFIKQTTIKDCRIGVALEGAGGVLEDVTVEGSAIAYTQANSIVQLTQFQVKNVPDKGVAILLEGGLLTLLNCALGKDQVKIDVLKKLPEPTVVLRCMQYVVVGVKDAPAGCLVDVRSVKPNVKPGMTDPNIRNTPTPLIEGRTPPASALTPLIVQAWWFDDQGKYQPAPAYTINVLGPAAKEGDDRPTLKTVNFQPADNAFRALNDPAPTVEVSLK